MADLERSAAEACAELEDFLYCPGGAVELLHTTLGDEGDEQIDGLYQVLRTVGAGAIRLSGRMHGGIVADLGQSEAAILNENWKVRGLIPRNGPLSFSHQLHINRQSKPLVLCPVRQTYAGNQLLISPATALERLEFTVPYKELVCEALRRLEG